MTVEQPTLPAYSQKNTVTDDNYAKIEEVTGINDRQRIDQAISTVCEKNGAFEVEDVIQELVTEPYNHSQEVECYMAAGETTDTEASSSGTMCKNAEAKKTNESSIQTKGEEKGVIDLTNENATSENEQIQKAIAESLRDNSAGILGGQISREEQEISRVLEQSLQDNKVGNKRKRGDIWFVDPLNPHERKRDGNWPVGLKNVGNTCWFSAVVQSLFHLPVFRRLVLDFPSPSFEKEGSMEKRNIQFMQELRRLFALMVVSKRKYVDPSKAVEILKEAFTGGNAAQTADTGQQDVSEFQHKLLEWLEDAFRTYQTSLDNQQNLEAGTEAPCSDEKLVNNPMIQLFYGQFMAEGVLEGTRFTNKETFGQFPLQVDGFKNIHESLEAGTAEGEIETGQSSTAQSGQEHWFTKLPPVLTFELSRFQFNQKLGRPEKIHNTLEFPELIYLDRYLEDNKNITRQKRLEVKKIKEELQILQDKLDKFINYGSGAKRFPLQDVLQYALEFAQSKETSCLPHAVASPGAGSTGSAASGSQNTMSFNSPSVLSPSQSAPSDMEVESPKSHVSMHSPDVTMTSALFPPDLTFTSPTQQHKNPTPTSTPSTPPTLINSPTALANNNKNTNLHPSLQGSYASSNTMDCETPTPSPSKVCKLSAPSPKHVSQQELCVLQSCLRRWRTEVENDVKELQDSINALDECVNNMYSEEALNKVIMPTYFCLNPHNFLLVPYRLHAVLVHEGQAASGHYWAYLYNERCKKWLKFNDITVSESSWEELAQDSFGGYHNASAYCLMYIDGRRKDLLQEEIDNETGQTDVLPIDLQKYVNVDNALFDQEIEDWDNRDNTQASTSSDDVQCVGESKASQSTQTNSPVRQSLATKHANLTVKQSLDLIHKARRGRTLIQEQANDVLREVCQHELTRTNQTAQRVNQEVPRVDQRLESIQIYLYANQYVVVNARNRILFEQFALPNVLIEDQSTAVIAKAAKTQITILSQKATENEEQTYVDYHEKYAAYRKVVNLFVSGFQSFHDDSFPEALSLLCSACDMNRALTLIHTYPMRGLDKKILNFFRRECLLHLNEQTSGEFERGENLEGLTQVMNKILLPCLGSLTLGGSTQEDEATVEEIRERWCSFLSMELPENQHEKLQEFLSRMFDPATESPKVGFVHESRRIKDCDLMENYKKAMNTIHKTGYLEKAVSRHS